MKPIDFAHLIANTTDVANRLIENFQLSPYLRAPGPVVDEIGLGYKRHAKRAANWFRFDFRYWQHDYLSLRFQIPKPKLPSRWGFPTPTGDPWAELAETYANRNILHEKLMQDFQNLHKFLTVHKTVPQTRIQIFMEALSKQPIITVAELAKSINVSRDTARRWLMKLAQGENLKYTYFKGMNQFAYIPLVLTIDFYVAAEYDHLRHGIKPKKLFSDAV